MSLHVYECDLRRGTRLGFNVFLRWQPQHSHTQTCVWHEGGERISYPTIPSSSFSCCAVQTLEPALNSCRQALGGKQSGFAVAVPPGPAGESQSLPNTLHLCPPFVPPNSSSSHSSLPSPPDPLPHVFRDCLRKMMVPPQLAGLWFTETNK